MKVEEIQNEIFFHQDEKYREFQIKLIPTVEQCSIIGVRTPVLRHLAKELYRENDYLEFINDLPHKYFDENQLHAFLISEIKDYELCIDYLNKFLPFVDNWATCDQLSPKVFKKNKEKLIEEIKEWINSDKNYIKRFGIGALMQHFLDESFDVKYLSMVSKVESKEYYVKMMISWFFATALAKHYEETLPFLENRRLEKWIHNKTIQKAIESYRISKEKKEYLRTLKII